MVFGAGGGRAKSTLVCSCLVFSTKTITKGSYFHSKQTRYFNSCFRSVLSVREQMQDDHRHSLTWTECPSTGGEEKALWVKHLLHKLGSRSQISRIHEDLEGPDPPIIPVMVAEMDSWSKLDSQICQSGELQVQRETLFQYIPGRQQLSKTHNCLWATTS